MVRSLDPAPEIKDYDQVVEEARGAAEGIGFSDVWRWVSGKHSQPTKPGQK